MLKKLISGLVVVSLILLLPAGITFNTGIDPIAVADDTTVQATAVAEVDEVLKLTGVIKEIPSSVETTPETDLWSFTTVNDSLNFGTLQEVRDSNDDFKYMTGENWYAVFLFPVSSGLPYEITETAGPLVGEGPDNAGVVIDKAFILLPEYQAQDKWKASDEEGQGLLDAGDAVGDASSAVGSNPVFTGGSGKARIIRAYLSIGGPDKGTGKIVSCNGGRDGGTCIDEGDDYAVAVNGWEAVTQDQKPGPYSNEGSPVTFTLNLT